MRRRKRFFKKKLRILGVVLTMGILVLALVTVDKKLRPLVQSYGYMSARRTAMLAVHTGVERVLASDALSYADLVTVERDDEGKVLSAEANVGAINRLKAAANNAVTEELLLREKQNVSIPLGSLLGGSFFTGRGPFLNIAINTSGVVISELTGEFIDAGINQTNHRLSLDMLVMITAALPAERVSLEIKTNFLVCETVIVGQVPQTVLQVDFGEGLKNIFGKSD